MKRRTSWISLTAVGLILSVALYGCATLSGLMNLGKLQFKLANVNGFRLNGVDVSRIASRGQIGPMDVIAIGSAFAQKRLPVDFTLNVDVKNPNTGANGAQPTPLYLNKIAWTLLIDDRTTINGVTNQNLQIPGNGQSITLPITMSLDLYKFFSDRGLDDLLNLALAVGGNQGSSSRLKMTARITATVPGTNVPITYPGDITIINQGFSNP